MHDPADAQPSAAPPVGRKRGRPPLGDQAMTVAEHSALARQRKREQLLAGKAAVERVAAMEAELAAMRSEFLPMQRKLAKAETRLRTALAEQERLRGELMAEQQASAKKVERARTVAARHRAQAAEQRPMATATTLAMAKQKLTRVPVLWCRY